MIYVALGTHERPFYRLVKEVERLIGAGKIKQKVIVQLGFTDYWVKGAECHKYLETEEMEKCIKNCSMMVTHGGLGSIMRGIKAGKPVVVVPRRRMYNEHSDDHQLQIVEETKKLGNVIPVYDIRDLEVAIDKARKLKVRKKFYESKKIFNIIDKKLKEWEKG